MTEPAGRPRVRPPLAAWVAAAVLVTGAAVFVRALDAVRERGTTVRADRSIVDFVASHRAEWATHVARAWTVLGSGWVVGVLVTIAVIALLVRRRPGVAAVVAASALGTSIAVSVTKQAVARARPPVTTRVIEVTGAAFPSGHAANSVALYGALAWAVTTQSRSHRVRAWAWGVAAFVALGVGCSRVYLGVHWPSDVVGGWALAAAWLAALILAEVLLEARAADDRR